MRNQWSLLRDVYQEDRTNLTGYDLINIYINCNDKAHDVKIYTTNNDWLEHGTFVLIVSNMSRGYKQFK